MANEITSGLLAAALNDKMINEAFEIARKSRTGILSTIQMGMAKRPFEGYKIGWLDAQVDAQGSLVDGSQTAVEPSIEVDDGTKFRAGMTVSVKGSDEVMLVDSVAANVLTVVRGFGGTTAETIADDAEIYVDSSSREENSLAENDGIYQPEDVNNHFQTMDTAIEMSRRALATLQFGDTNNLQFQLQERLRQLSIQMDRMVVRGRRATATVAGALRTYSGGLAFYNDQAGAIKVDHAAAALTLDALYDLNKEVVRQGGNTNTLAVGINKAQAISRLIAAEYNSQRLGDWQADEGSVLTLPSDLPLIGNVNRIVIDTNINDDEVFMYDSGMVSIVPMSGANGGEAGAWQTKDATQPGQDGERARILGDFSLEVRQSKTHLARLHNIA